MARAKPRWNLVWPVLAAISTLGFAFVVPALLTTPDTLAGDPCASGWNNPYALTAHIVLLVGPVGSVSVLVSALIKRDRVGMVTGVFAIVVSVLVLFVGVVASSAGYGWHCPEF